METGKLVVVKWRAVQELMVLHLIDLLSDAQSILCIRAGLSVCTSVSC